MFKICGFYSSSLELCFRWSFKLTWHFVVIRMTLWIKITFSCYITVLTLHVNIQGIIKSMISSLPREVFVSFDIIFDPNLNKYSSSQRMWYLLTFRLWITYVSIMVFLGVFTFRRIITNFLSKLDVWMNFSSVRIKLWINLSSFSNDLSNALSFETKWGRFQKTNEEKLIFCYFI